MEPREPAPPSPARPEPDFRRLFEGAPGSYLVLDPALTIVAASEAYLAATMTKREEIIGRHLFEVFPDNPDDPSPSGVSNLRASLDRVRAQLVPDSMAVQRYDIRQPKGGFEERFWSPVNSPVLDDAGQLEYILHRVEDVTEYVKLRQEEAQHRDLAVELVQRTAQMEADIVARSQELRDLNEQLREANDAKSDFLSRVSHELRTPLTSILGFAELLTLSEIGEKEGRFAEAIFRAGRHLLDLLNELLDVSRIHAGTFSMSVGPVGLMSVLEEAAQLMQPVAQARKIDFQVSIDPARSVYVVADAQRLRQICINLLSNAVKYNHDGGSVALQVECPTESKARISVTDTGPGIPPDSIKLLFVPFERLDAGTSGIEGTGLGLALSRMLAEAMGGTLGVTSRLGEGSTFWIDLQRTEPAALIEESRFDGPIAAVKPYPHEPTVLYIEDIAANVDLIAEVIRRRPGARLLSAKTGGAGLELAREHRPDLILLDLHLPDMGGMAVLEGLRAEPDTEAIPVLILSADATHRQRDALLKAGAQGYLTKPISVTSLLAAFDERIGGSPGEDGEQT